MPKPRNLTEATAFVIYDELGPGWAWQTVMGDWIFTRFPENATRFKTRAEADAVRKKHYGHTRTRLIIQEVPA